MKKIIYILGSLTLTILLSINFSGCVKQNFDDIEPRVDTTSLVPNTTIAQLKALYTGSLLKLTDSTFYDRDSIIIEGIVVSDDTKGNFYKSIVIEQEDGSAAIEVKLDKTNLSNDYKRGQRVLIYCNNLYLGDYYGLIQLGSTYTENHYEQLGGIEGDILIKKHVFRNGGTLVPMTPMVLSPSALNVANVSKLVTVEKVKFSTRIVPGSSPEIVLTFADKHSGESVDHLLAGFTDVYSNLVVRTSGYAEFANNPLPDGWLNITGVLSYYTGSTTNYQLIIRDLNDIKIVP